MDPAARSFTKLFQLTVISIKDRFEVLFRAGKRNLSSEALSKDLTWRYLARLSLARLSIVVIIETEET